MKLMDLGKIDSVIYELDCISDNHKLFLKTILERRFEELFKWKITLLNLLYHPRKKSTLNEHTTYER